MSSTSAAAAAAAGTMSVNVAETTGVRYNAAVMTQLDSQYPDLHVVFDFFVDNPQKVMPVPIHQAVPVVHGHDCVDQTAAAAAVGGGGVGGTGGVDGQGQTGRRDNPFYDPYWESIRIMQESNLFMEGMLLRSVDCKPNFPYIHYIIYNSPKPSDKLTTGNSGTRYHNPMMSSFPVDIVAPSNGRYGTADANRQFIDILRSRGGYSEIHTFVDRHTPLLPKRPANPNAAYIVSAFKTAGNLESLDRTWTYWSGADYIVENIPKALRLERVTFHKLKQGHEKDNFSYVLLCEVSEALSDMNRAREFIDTLKYRQCGVTSLYVIDHFF